MNTGEGATDVEEVNFRPCANKEPASKRLMASGLRLQRIDSINEQNK